MMTDESNPDLESFRQQWKAEVSSKKTNQAATRQTQASSSLKPAPRRPSNVPKPAVNFGRDGPHDEEVSSDDDGKASHQRNKRTTGPLAEFTDFPVNVPVEKEPESALEHYEKAVERETQGNLGDSLNLYRKAFRMDDRVDLKYKNKHFPPSAPKPLKPVGTNPSNASATMPNTAHHSSEDPPAVAMSTPELISSFATLPIARKGPAMEGEPLPPCPIYDLPEEILVQILTFLALMDLPSFMSVSRVCKRLAYLVATEETIWKRICIGSEIGYGGMVYEWKVNVDGTPLEEDISDELAGLSLETPPRTPTPPNHPSANNATTAAGAARTIAVPSLLPPPILMPTFSPKYPTYAKMFRHRPRIRFNGIYISTVNYIRAGAANTTHSTWGAPVHIVTYYRYLRFFRDGRCLSLLTTHEPTEIVHQFTPDLLEKKNVIAKDGRQGRQRRDRQVISEAKEDPLSLTYKGRWKLGNGEHLAEGKEEFDESALNVETEGCYEKYTYRMDFHLRGQEKGRSRLVWDGFWCFNKENETWGEIGRKNEKGFVFSKVRSYGLGG